MSLVQKEMLFLDTTRSKIYHKNNFCHMQKLKEYLLFMTCLKYNCRKKYSTVFKDLLIKQLARNELLKNMACYMILCDILDPNVYLFVIITNIYITKMLVTWISHMLLDHSNHCVCMNQSIA